ncbi:MAG: selenide, water dikinase SelD [Chloroflexi bacterium]|nr:selenide, water dikinase SelD [Chloroflexota bacterium]
MTLFSTNIIKLTSLAGAAGCAAKLGAGDLSEVAFPLGQLFDSAAHPNLMVGLAEPDDAAVYKLNDTQAIISTTDFFPPVVDDPYWFGAIAAANAMSDVYAMGGEVLMAINLCAFPASLDLAILGEILRGGAEKVREAGAVVAGGHTIMDNEPKYGLAVTGVVHPDRVLTKGGAQSGDALILTKPLGAGVITTALKQGKAHDNHVENAMRIMAMLNRAAAQAAQQIGVHAMTDVTGYSLLGHGREMANLSGVNLHIHPESLQWMDGVWDYAEQNIFPGGMGRNRGFYGKWVQFADSIDEITRKLLFDPQTSGGLLIAVGSEQADFLLKTLAQQGINGQRIGEVTEGDGLIVVD